MQAAADNFGPARLLDAIRFSILSILEVTMLASRFPHRLIGGMLVLALVAAQFGCAVDRLRKPIADYQGATSVVTAQARLAFGEINRVERVRAVKTARRLGKRLDPRVLEAETTFLTGEDLATRLDALDHLDEYAKLLSQIVNSDAPDKVATSATNLETALNGLADRISKLANTSPPANAASDSASAATSKPNNVQFKKVFGIFASVTREVLVFVVRKKQNDALKRAVEAGDAPVNNLIDALKDDLRLAYALKRNNLDKDMVQVFQAYNKEITAPEPDKDRLDELEKAVIDNLDAQDAFYATDPTEALDKMKQAHSKMVAYARQDDDASLTEAVGAIQSFVESATRLGAAVVKLRSTNTEKS
jgi:hypothetical protein